MIHFNRVLSRRHGLNAGLFLLVAGLAALAWFAPDQESPTVGTPLLSLTADQVDRIIIEQPDQTRLIFVRAGSETAWQMQAPEPGRANPILMRALLELAEARCTAHSAVTGLDLAELHLQPPQLRLWLNDHELAFGSVAPVSGLRYVRSGATVALCPDDWMRLLTSAAASFRTAPLPPTESP